MDEKGIMIPVERIKQSIVFIRGQKVMLFPLIYGCPAYSRPAYSRIFSRQE